MKIYDISQTLREGFPVWPGDEEYRIRWTTRLTEGASCNVAAVTMSTHSGTHIDAPYHFDEIGRDVAQLDLGVFVGPARVVEIEAKPCIRASHLTGLPWEGVERVLFRTYSGNAPEEQWDSGFTYLGEDAAEFLGELGVVLVGTDAPSIDAFDSKDLKAHKGLYRHRVAVLEGVRLMDVPPGDYELICLPLRLAGLDGSPVRAVLRK